MNKKITSTVFSVLVILLLTAFADGQQAPPDSKISPEKQILIKEYFEAIGGRASINKILDAVFVNLDNTLPTMLVTSVEENPNLTGAQKADIQKSMPEMVARMNKRMREGLNREIDFAKVIEEINYPLLNKFFTEAELKDLIVFYKSPTGQKAILLQPQLYTEATAKLNAILIPAMQKVMKKVTEDEINDRLKETKQGQ